MNESECNEQSTEGNCNTESEVAHGVKKHP